MIGARTVIVDNPTAVKAHQPIFNRSKRSQEKEQLPVAAHCKYQMLLDPERGQQRFPRTTTLSNDSEATPGDEDWGVLEHSGLISSTYLEQVGPCDFFCLALNLPLLPFVIVKIIILRCCHRTSYILCL